MRISATVGPSVASEGSFLARSAKSVMMSVEYRIKPEAHIMNQMTIQTDAHIRLSGQHAVLLRRLAESRSIAQQTSNC
jgi:hypothetical protein